MSLTNLFEDDAGALKVSDDQVSGIAGLAKRVRARRALVNPASERRAIRGLLAEVFPGNR